MSAGISTSSHFAPSLDVGATLAVSRNRISEYRDEAANRTYRHVEPINALEDKYQGMSDIVRFDVAVKDSSFHVFDYNPFIRDDDLSSCFVSQYYLRNETILV